MRVYDADRTVAWCRACGRLDRWRGVEGGVRDHYLGRDPSAYVCICGAAATSEQARMTDAIRAGALRPVQDETTWSHERST